jgi:glycerate-2-kinase
LDRPPARQLTGAIERLRADAAEAGAAAVAAVSPHALVPAALAGLGATLGLTPRPLHVLAVGKAAAAMFEAFVAVAPAPIARCLVIGPRRPDGWPSVHPFVAGGHPLATAASVEGGLGALALAADVPEDGCLVCLLSGGASALMAAPMPGLTLAVKQRVVVERRAQAPLGGQRRPPGGRLRRRHSDVGDLRRDRRRPERHRVGPGSC